MELKPTSHSYYCNDGNYYSNDSLVVFQTWSEFKESWMNDDLSIDHDYNHCFRFDIVNKYDSDTDEELEGVFSLKLYMILQRKGIFISITIEEIEDSDMMEIKKYLSDCWDYIKGQWEEFNG